MSVQLELDSLFFYVETLNRQNRRIVNLRVESATVRVRLYRFNDRTYVGTKESLRSNSKRDSSQPSIKLYSSEEWRSRLRSTNGDGGGGGGSGDDLASRYPSFPAGSMRTINPRCYRASKRSRDGDGVARRSPLRRSVPRSRGRCWWMRHSTEKSRDHSRALRRDVRHNVAKRWTTVGRWNAKCREICRR